MTRRLFWEDAYRLEFEASVVSTGKRDGSPTVVLDQTAFYPESGGQPHDVGRLGDIDVIDVQEDGESIVHILERAITEGETVKGSVNAERRRDHRQQHHGQHLLSRAFVELAGANTRSFHLGERSARSISTRTSQRRTSVAPRAEPTRSSGRLGRSSPDPSLAKKLRAWAFTSTRTPERPSESSKPRTSTGRPAAAHTPATPPRSVSSSCSGRSAPRAPLGFASSADTEPSRPAHDRIGAIDELGAVVLGAARRPRRSCPSIAGTAAGGRATEPRAAGIAHSKARRIGFSAQPRTLPPIVMASYDGWSPSDLRGLAQHLTRLGECVALLGARSDKAHLIFAQSESLDLDVPGLLKEAVEKLGGRGGGRRHMGPGRGRKGRGCSTPPSQTQTTTRGGRLTSKPRGARHLHRWNDFDADRSRDRSAVPALSGSEILSVCMGYDARRA